MVNVEATIERIFPLLVAGQREDVRSIVQEAKLEGMSAEDLTHEIFWPVLEIVNKLYRADQLTMLAYQYATRLLRALVDQAQAEYAQHDRRHRRVLMFCGPSESDELAGQLVADLAEADGYEIFFGGGGVANDEILEEVGKQQPDILLMFASAPSDAPNIRILIDTIRNVDACPNLQIVVGGGVFNRADGLAEEIGADLWVKDPRQLLDKLVEECERRATPEQRTVGRHRRTAKSEAA